MKVHPEIIRLLENKELIKEESKHRHKEIVEWLQEIDPSLYENIICLMTELRYAKLEKFKNLIEQERENEL